MRARTWVALGVFAAALALMIWLARRESGARSIRFSDGRVFAIKAVTFGTEHRHIDAPAWSRVMAPIVPNRFKARLRIRTHTFKTEQSTLMIWGQWHYSRTNSPVSFAAIGDDSGLESMPVHYQSSSFSRASDAIMGWNFSNYPRRQAMLRLALYPSSDSSAKRLAVISFKNPAPATTPAFVASTLPVSRYEDGVTFSLTEFTVGGAMPRRWRGFNEPGRPWNIATFQLTQGDHASAAWRVLSLLVTDGSGNFVNCRMDTFAAAVGEIGCRFNDVLWPDEPAHRLTAEFIRTSLLPSNELFTVKAIPLPTNDRPVRVTPTAEVHGVKITSLELSTTSSGPVPPDVVRPNAHLVVRALPVVRGVRPILSDVRDDQGRAVRFDEISLFQNGSLWFALEIPPGAARIDATVAITRTRFIEFVAQPHRPRELRPAVP